MLAMTLIDLEVIPRLAQTTPERPRQYWVLVWSACTPELLRLQSLLAASATGCTPLAGDPSTGRVLLSCSSTTEVYS